MGIFSFFAVQANAQSGGNGFSISPTRIPLDNVNPGETVETDITVRNITEQPVTAVMEVNDFVPQGESGTPKLLLEDEPTDFTLRSYVRDIDPIQLEPGESREVRIFIDVPENATPGGHYGVVRFTSQNDQNDGNVALTASVGTPILLRVNGDLVFDAELLELSAARNGETGNFFEYSPDTVVTRLQNNGNTHVQPFGAISIKNIFGSEVESFELNKSQSETRSGERGYLLPDSVRRFENELSSNLFFGRYTIEGNISYSSGSGDYINVSDTFWVIPWKIIVVAIAVIALLAYGGTKGIKAYNQRILSKAKRK